MNGKDVLDESQYRPKCPDSPIVIVNVADLVNPETGKTYREENAELKHNIPIGALVEDVDTGIRLFVVAHGRDCDQTPLYCIGPDPDDGEEAIPGFANRQWVCGYSEESLRVINLPQ